LNIQNTDEELQQHDIEHGLVATPGSLSQHDIGLYIVKVFQKTKGAWKRLKWVSIDEKKVKELLQQIKYFVDELEIYLNRARRQRCPDRVEVDWRRIIVGTTNSEFLALTGSERTTDNREAAIRAAAQWRKIGLELGVLEVLSGTSNYHRYLYETRQQIEKTTNSVHRLDYQRTCPYRRENS
jgi:hypothetical protein